MKRKTPRPGNRVRAMVAKQLRSQPALEEAWNESGPRRALSSALMRLRKQAGLTQAEVASAVEGWDQPYVSKLESATGPWPTQDTVRKFAEACHAGVGYVFFRESETKLTVEGTVTFGSRRRQEAFGRLVKGPDELAPKKTAEEA